MDDKMRAQGLKALAKVRIAAEAAAAELEDIVENGCGAPKQVGAAQARIEKIKVLAHEAHSFISKAHTEEKNASEGKPLPFKEGEEATKPSKGGAKDRKSAAAGDGGEG